MLIKRNSHFPGMLVGIFLVLGSLLLMLSACLNHSPIPALPGDGEENRLFSPVAPTATQTILLLSTFTPTLTSTPAVSYVRIRNLEMGAYLYDAEGRAMLGDLPVSDFSSHWVIEDYQGSKRLWNRASGNYLSIEHLLDYVEVIPVYPVWMSPRWTFVGGSDDSGVVLRNVWHNWQVLYAEGEVARYGEMPTTDPAARWVFEPVDGKALPTATSTPTVVIPSPSQPAGSRGATVPWVEYEAEEGQTNGEILGPDRTWGTIAAESSGRRAVKLDAVGEYVQFRSRKRANAIVVRYVIPDSEDGQGLEATLSLYVNGKFRYKMPLTSRYAWSYGGEEYTFNVPGAGGAHHFYDESRALVGEIPVHATVRLQVDPDDEADYYVIDLVDLEEVPPPLTKPEGYLSIVEDCGAIPNDAQDDGAAIQACIDRARLAQVGVWIPAGTFESLSRPFEVKEVTIQGAGMWYSVIHGPYATFNCVGDRCRYRDFAILGETITRNDRTPDNGFHGGAGFGSLLENIWVEHTKVGYWVGGATHGLIIRNSRFRNLFADGVNFCNGTSYSVVENSHFRNTGDDALASWSPKGSEVNTHNIFRFNTVQLPWRANCFAIYGGADNRIEDNLCYDVVTYPGILIAQHFNSNPFEGTTWVQRNSLIRAGGPMFKLQHGALKVWADQGEIKGLVIQDVLIDSPTFSGLELEGSYPLYATIERVEIRQAGDWGIFLHANLVGEVSFSAVRVWQPGRGGLLNYTPKAFFKLILGAGNDGW